MNSSQGMVRMLGHLLWCCMLLVLVPAFIGASPAQEETDAAQPAAPEQQATGRWATPADYEMATGNSIGTFSEAPMLQEMVSQGLLPPVADRLPEQPLVVRGADGVGTYGGRLRLVAQGPVPPAFNPGMVDTMMAEHDFGTGLHPNVGWIEMLDDVGKEWLVRLRPGMKWSNGDPFTADDALFWYQNVALNTDLTPALGGYLKVAGEVMKIEKLDDHSYKLSASQPFDYARPRSAIWYYANVFPMNYLKDFHPAYTDADKLDGTAKEAGFDTWMQLFLDRADRHQVRNPDFPTIMPWKIQNPAPATPVVYTRNPYYHVVDEVGNQLPYIDELHTTIVQNAETVNLKILAGEVDWVYAGSAGSLYPLLKEAEASDQKITVARWREAEPNAATIYFNLNHKDPVLRDIFQDKRFRFAVSYSLDRHTINELIYLGVLEPYQVAPLQGGRFYHDQLAHTAVEYDVDRANGLLDEMGLEQRDDEGIRLRPDGKKLFITMITFPMWGSFPEAAELGEILADNLKDVGIEINLRIMDHALWDERTKANEFDAFYGGGTWGLLEGTYLSGTGLPHWTTTHLSFHALQWNLWKDSDGAMGEQPPPAMLDAYAAYDAAKTSFDAAEQERYMKEVLDIAADNLWTVGLLTKFGRVMVFNAKLANAPTVNRNWWRGDKGRPELYYWRE